MTDVEPVVTDFAASGRAGRRNALPDILGSSAGNVLTKLFRVHLTCCFSLDEGAAGGETSSSNTTTENQETEMKSMDS
uniref:cAMP-dependent protein kinase inhibitor beta n=1 Tax=Podarcis muralis TaxID=64176 RepID=A0A670HYE1_PODMU